MTNACQPNDVDGHDLIRAAAGLTRDLNRANPVIFWTDLLASVLLGYGALALACMTGGSVRLVAGAVAVLALYRAESFIHELTHLKPTTVRGFRTAWNVLVGIPMMVPSFLYEGVHNLHHARTRYGTAQDPEYLPLAGMSRWALPPFVLLSLLTPLLLLVRFAVLAPLSLYAAPVRRIVVERWSALTINPAFRRRPPDGAFRRRWLIQESATSLWAIATVGLTIAGWIPVRVALTCLATVSVIACLNQVRTLAAHLWEGDGTPFDVTAQYLDSVNVPPPALLPMLWAPVGLRYHALHHLLPGIPYHALGEAHRRLSASLPTGSPYAGGNHRSLPALLTRLWQADRAVGRPPPT
ncbi:fatty acid desaturase family protein [Sphingomonas montana]|uniref:fatty acid desaturase family protein n=1 Tax=Sphingomonas montana TaxID=1843236 RepID=UPI00096E5A1D|nr:fatty acid desaturase [Sphingomonas montana]